MASLTAYAMASSVWNTTKLSGKPVDADLTEAFAEIVDRIIAEPWLGNATNEQLVDELRARLATHGLLQYKTVDEVTQKSDNNVQPHNDSSCVPPASPEEQPSAIQKLRQRNEWKIRAPHLLH